MKKLILGGAILIFAIFISAGMAFANDQAPAQTELSVSCPEGMTKNYVETVTVPANSSSATLSSMNTTLGGTYLLVSSNAWENRNNTNQKSDAEYSTMDNWSTSMDGYNMGDFQLGTSEFDLTVDGAFVNWGPYNPVHEYVYPYTGTGEKVNLLIFDGNSNDGPTATNSGWYGDNSGSLNVDIYSCTAHQASSGSVHIFKYVNGEQATAENVNGVSFPMITPTYGNAPFTLGLGGWTTGDVNYEASTGTIDAGGTYTAYENTDTNLVSSSCDGTHPYALVGYSSGKTMEEALAAPKSLTPPTINIDGDAFIIVWNQTCQLTPPIKVHILKYLDGVKVESIANNYQFPMTATWQTANLNGGASTSGNYVLGNNHGGAIDLYGADTAPMAVPADYTTSEITDNTSQVVASQELCAPGKYLLKGYRSSSLSFADAANQTLTATAPIFTGLTSDRYVIVENSTCQIASISGSKYNDRNRNGKRDNGEEGLQGWVIKLISENENEDSDMLIATTTTDVNGNYSFQNIVPGTYEVRETHQKGWKRFSKNPKDIVISADSTVTGVDFGNALKQKKEKEDTDQDDNRDEQPGKYQSGHGKSDYGHNQGNHNENENGNGKEKGNGHQDN